MKHFSEYLNESLDNTIFEGFLDKLKDAIENVVDNPKKYFDSAREIINRKKDNQIKMYNKDPEGIGKSLDELNNDKDLKIIYKYYKKKIEAKEMGEMSIPDWFAGEDKKYLDKMEIAIKKVQSDNIFNDCDENKAFAIILIMNACMWASHNQKSSSSNSSSYKSSYSSSSRARRAGAIAGCMAAGMRMRH